MKTEQEVARGGRSLAWLGALVSWAGMLTYFLVVPRWPDLRDSGHLNVAVSSLGMLLSLIGLIRARAPGFWSGSGTFALVLGAFPTIFLAFYIYYFSYQLPPDEPVVKVGMPAPEFLLPDQDGRQRSLAEFRGRQFYLIFFRGPW